MRPSGIEPEAIAWEAMILPLNQERLDRLKNTPTVPLCKDEVCSLVTSTSLHLPAVQEAQCESVTSDIVD